VLALASYWMDHTKAIMEAEARFPDRCHRVRYEDLVDDPERVAERMFRFLGLPPAPGISAECFNHERERFGNSDYKIWNTSRITADSVGRGWAIPAGDITPPVKAAINEMTSRLGYVPIGPRWGAASRPADMRLAADGTAPVPARAGAANEAQRPPDSPRLIGDRLRTGLSGLNDRFARRWDPYARESFLLVEAGDHADADAWWRVDLASGTATVGRGMRTQDAHWTVTAPPGAWDQVICDGTNLGVAFRRYGMRYVGSDGAGSFAADTRVAMMADLLGITTWREDTAGEHT
jgi:hypothetical protein